jgi:hypothetical protein
MRYSFSGILSAFLFAAFMAALPIQAQQAPDGFHWVDFHSQSDENVVVWVTRALTVENWTAIREIGEEYDAALVVTTLRSSPQSGPSTDSFTIWSVSLTSHEHTPLLKGVNLRLLDWMLFAPGRPRELAAMYDNCTGCQASTFLTAFHYDLVQHAWVARWLESGRGAPMWTANTPSQIDMTQAYAVMAEDNGHEYLATLRHFDYGKRKPSDDFVYVYDVNPFTGLDRVQVMSAGKADDAEMEICRAQDVVSGLARGQNSPFCLSLLGSRPPRKPVTAPPANGRGQSMPPGAKREKTSN